MGHNQHLFVDLKLHEKKKTLREVTLLMDSIKEEMLCTGVRHLSCSCFLSPPRSPHSCISQSDNGLFLCTDVQAAATVLH